jgi:hypothetical protein
LSPNSMGKDCQGKILAVSSRLQSRPTLPSYQKLPETTIAMLESGSRFDKVSGSDSESGSGPKREKMTHINEKVKKLNVLKCLMFSFEGGRLLL